MKIVRVKIFFLCSYNIRISYFCWKLLFFRQ